MPLTHAPTFVWTIGTIHIKLAAHLLNVIDFVFRKLSYLFGLSKHNKYAINLWWFHKIRLKCHFLHVIKKEDKKKRSKIDWRLFRQVNGRMCVCACLCNRTIWNVLGWAIIMSSYSLYYRGASGDMRIKKTNTTKIDEKWREHNIQILRHKITDLDDEISLNW